MSKSLPKTSKLTVYIYPSSGHWMIKSDTDIDPDTLYTTPNEALEAAREVFKFKEHDPKIIICNENIESIRLSA